MPSWAASIDVGQPVELKSSLDGRVVVVVGPRHIAVFSAKSGRVRARFTTAESLGTVVTDESVLIRSQNSIVSYDFDGRSHGRIAASDITDLAAGSRTVFAIRHDIHNVQTPYALLAFGPFGALRWSQSLGGSSSLLSVLPQDVVVVQTTAGEPLFASDFGYEAQGGHQLWRCFNVETDPVGMIDGVVQCRLHSPSAQEVIDGYHPAFIQRFALFGYDRGIRAYRPDAPVLEKIKSDQPADAVFSDAQADYVGLAGELFRYQRSAAQPDLPPQRSEGVSPLGITVGRHVVLHRQELPFGLAFRKTTPELIPFAPAGTTVSAELAFAPYLVEKTQRGWLAVNVDDPTTLARFEVPCASALVVAARRSFVFACAGSGATRLTGFSVDVQPSFDAIDRDDSEHNPAAEATPTPTPAPVAILPLVFEIDANRRRDDLRPRVFSPAVRSVVVTIDARTSLAPQDLDATQSPCTSVPDGVACTVDIPVPYGSHRMSMLFFDRAGGRGVALSATSAQIDNYGAVRPVDLYIHGIPAAIAVRQQDPAVHLVAGHPQDISLEIIAFDHDGFPILNRADYFHPIGIRLVHPPGATSVSTSSISRAHAPLVVHYDGSRGANIKVVASARDVGDVQLTLPIVP